MDGEVNDDGRLNPNRAVEKDTHAVNCAGCGNVVVPSEDNFWICFTICAWRVNVIDILFSENSHETHF